MGGQDRDEGWRWGLELEVEVGAAVGVGVGVVEDECGVGDEPSYTSFTSELSSPNPLSPPPPPNQAWVCTFSQERILTK